MKNNLYHEEIKFFRQVGKDYMIGMEKNKIRPDIFDNFFFHGTHYLNRGERYAFDDFTMYFAFDGKIFNCRRI